MGPDNVCPLQHVPIVEHLDEQLLWCRRRHLGPEVQQSGPKHPLELGRSICLDAEVSMMTTFICKLAVVL
jgi:hypothetical protein